MVSGSKMVVQIWSPRNANEGEEGYQSLSPDLFLQLWNKNSMKPGFDFKE